MQIFTPDGFTLLFHICEGGYQMITCTKLKYVTMQWHANHVTICGPKNIKRLFCQKMCSYFLEYNLKEKHLVPHKMLWFIVWFPQFWGSSQYCRYKLKWKPLFISECLVYWTYGGFWWKR